MPDEIPTASPAASHELQSLAEALGHDVQDIRVALAAYKTGGKAALFASLPSMVSDIQSTFTAVKAELPEIKAGYKTTEFWLTAGVVVGNIVFSAITGKAIPVEVNVVIGGVVAVYSAVRALIKKPTPPAA